MCPGSGRLDRLRAGHGSAGLPGQGLRTPPDEPGVKHLGVAARPDGAVSALTPTDLSTVLLVGRRRLAPLVHVGRDEVGDVYALDEVTARSSASFTDLSRVVGDATSAPVATNR